jgi:hypothetical protein
LLESQKAVCAHSAVKVHAPPAARRTVQVLRLQPTSPVLGVAQSKSKSQLSPTFLPPVLALPKTASHGDEDEDEDPVFSWAQKVPAEASDRMSARQALPFAEL